MEIATKAVRFDEAVAPLLSASYNYARWLVRNAEDAEDVVQEACLRAFQGFDRFRGENLRPWFFTIVRNTCYTWLKKNRPKEPFLSFYETIDTVGSEEHNPQTVVLQKVDRESLKNGIESLPNEYREVFILRELEDLSYKEIATVAGVPMGTVMSRLARARGILQKYLIESETKGETP